MTSVSMASRPSNESLESIDLRSMMRPKDTGGNEDVILIETGNKTARDSISLYMVSYETQPSLIDLIPHDEGNSRRKSRCRYRYPCFPGTRYLNPRV